MINFKKYYTDHKTVSEKISFIKPKLNEATEQPYSEKYKAITGTQQGSNPGGIHTDKDGKKYYIKYYNNGDQAKSEALAGQIYHHMGIHTVSPKHEVINGRHAVVTEWNPHLVQMGSREFEHLSPEQATHIGKMYHGAILTKNWDIVGLVHDNIVKHAKTNDLYAVDHGGTFNFRARGGHKEYGPDIAEHSSLRNNGEASGHVFSHVFSQHPTAEKKSLSAVRDMDMKHVHKLFKNSGLENWKDLHSNFVERRKNLLAHYGENINEDYHPKKDDSGSTVKIQHPDEPSPQEHWNDSEKHASTIPGHDKIPSQINNIPVKKFETPNTWKNIDGQGEFKEPEFSPTKKKAVGVIMVEPDKRVWVVHPTNQFGGYSATFPKGTVEHGLNLRENAIKETHEESGLKAELHDHLGDFERTTSTSRYYIGKRTSGHPSDMGWESQKVSLVPMKDLHKVLTHPADQPIIEALRKKYK